MHSNNLTLFKPYLEWEYRKHPYSRRSVIRTNITRQITLMPSANLTRGFPISNLPDNIIRDIIEELNKRTVMLLVCKRFARLCGPDKLRHMKYVKVMPMACGPDEMKHLINIPLTWWFCNRNPALALPSFRIPEDNAYRSLTASLSLREQSLIHDYKTQHRKDPNTLRVYGHPGRDLPPDDNEWYYLIEFEHNERGTGKLAKLRVPESLAHWRIRKKEMLHSEVPQSWWEGI